MSISVYVMFAKRRKAFHALVASAVVMSRCVVAGVVEQPVRALQLAAAVDAALNASGSAAVAPLEPDEPLAPPAAVCAQVTIHCSDVQYVA